MAKQSTSTAQKILDSLDEEISIVDATIDAVNSVMPTGLTPSQSAAAASRLGKAIVTQPATTVKHALGLGTEYTKIALGVSKVEPNPRDRRFSDESFQKNPLYKRLAQAQVANENTAEALITDLDLDEKSRLRAEFIATLLTSSTAPTNNLLGNPAALRRARETNGKSLLDGIRHALYDLRNNGGLPSMVDTRPFTPGDTIAATPGQVVFKNEVLELIGYGAATSKVYRTPMLIVPPQINKFYVLDLAPGRSLVEHLVNHEHQVYIVSWRNPTAKQREWDMDTYVAALTEASNAVLSITGNDTHHLMGACAGGITSAVLAGYLQAIDDHRLATLNFLVTILDWEVPSTIGTMISGPTIAAARAASRRKGILSGDELSQIFAWLRPNDLIWNYVANNYLMGHNPPAFDVLAWNVDSTNLPEALHNDFLDMAETNGLIEPGKIVALDAPIDLSQLEIDTFVVGAVTDHITPWRACYPTVNAVGGNAEFVLSSQGHIQALVNPSGNPKGRYQINPDAATSNDVLDADEWLEGTTEHPGSWWDYWTEWLATRSGSKKTARKTLGNDEYPPLYDAPGQYIVEEV